MLTIKIIKFGIFQESILGPIIFLIYENLVYGHFNSAITSFTDDTVISYAVTIKCY